MRNAARSVEEREVGMWSIQQCADNASAHLSSIPEARRWHDLSGGDLRGPAYVPASDIREQMGIEPEALARVLAAAGFVVGIIKLADGVGGLVWGHTMVAMSEAELALMEEIERASGKLVTPDYERF